MAATPAWFFSTIAQATAAVIGLTIAFAISTQTRRKERIDDRTDELRNDLADFVEKYRYTLGTMARVLRETTEFESADLEFDLIDGNPEVWSSRQDNPATALAWANISGVVEILSNINELSEFMLTEEQHNELNSAVSSLADDVFNVGSDTSEQLYRELTGTPDSDPVPRGYHVEEIIDDEDRVESWLNRYTTERHSNLAGMPPDLRHMTGENISSWATVMDDLQTDAMRLSAKSIGTEVTQDFMSANFTVGVIKTNIKLGVAGIIIPLLLLISSPDLTLLNPLTTIPPGWAYNVATLLSEVLVLGFSIYYALKLFMIMLADARYEVPTMASALGTGPGFEMDLGEMVRDIRDSSEDQFDFSQDDTIFSTPPISSEDGPPETDDRVEDEETESE